LPSPQNNKARWAPSVLALLNNVFLIALECPRTPLLGTWVNRSSARCDELVRLASWDVADPSYAREFLQQWVPLHGIMNLWTGDRLPREVWIMDGDNNADRLLAKCDEASQEGYEGFLIDPPLTTLQGLGSVLPLTL
jgi:hypothetical protein